MAAELNKRMPNEKSASNLWKRPANFKDFMVEKPF
jgi:hypothetical protein